MNISLLLNLMKFNYYVSYCQLMRIIIDHINRFSLIFYPSKHFYGSLKCSSQLQHLRIRASMQLKHKLYYLSGSYLLHLISSYRFDVWSGETEKMLDFRMLIPYTFSHYLQLLKMSVEYLNYTMIS